MTILKAKDSNLQPIRELETTKKFHSNVDKFSLKVKEQKYACTAIKKATDEINKEYNLDITLREIRIDQFETGYSYDINQEILKKIEESGLLIVDISKHNGNVYHELGYMMGLNQAKGLHQENFIIIKSNDPKFKDDKVGFNITSIKQLRFDDTLQLVTLIKESLKKYYNLI